MHPTEVITQLEHTSNGQPVWITAEQSLFWVDQANSVLYQFNTQSLTLNKHSLSDPILSLSPSNKHGFIATLEDGIGFYDMKARKVVYISKPEPFTSNKIIGGVTDNRGSYWSFTQPRGQDSTEGNLYQISANLKTQRFTGEQLLCATPPGFSKDGLTLFQSAGASRYIYATSLDENRQPSITRAFCRIPKAEGYPHGLCVDSDDNLWVCHREVGLLSCFNSDGKRIERIEFDAPGLDYCTFGNDDLSRLFILTSDTNPHATHKKDSDTLTCCLISIEPGYKGLEAESFLG